MNTYECMYLIQANLSDDESEKANHRVIEEIEKRGGSVLRRDRLGKKRLAYNIGEHDMGVYYLMHFELPPAEVASLRAAYRMHPRLLRFLILRRDFEETPKAQKREPAAASDEKAGDETQAGNGTQADEGADDKARAEADEGEPAEGPSVESAPEEAPAGGGPEAEPTRQE